MKHKKYIATIIFTAIAGWISLYLVLTRLDPCTAPGVITICYSISTQSLVFFFLSGFFALTSTFTLLGWGLRLWLHRHEIYIDHLSVSLRQGILLSFCCLGALALVPLNALTWWTGFLLIGIIILIELYFTRD